MILGMSLSAFTLFHVVLSLIGIVAGVIVVFGWLNSRHFSGWTAWFLATTVLTSVTGYFFPTDRILPSHIVGALSLVVLVIAIVALYAYRLARAWRWIYVVSATIALWFNVFVLVAQAFAKISFLHSLAPTQSEPPFAIAQGVVLVVFIVLGVLAVRWFHPDAQAQIMRPA